MKQKMHDISINNLLKIHTLLLLSQGGKAGYDIKAALEKKLQKNLSNSHIYPFLNLLEKKKYVTTKTVQKREKKIYALTKEGILLLHSVLEQSSGLLDAILLDTIKKCTHCKCEVYKGAYEKKVQGKKVYFCCAACANHGMHT